MICKILNARNQDFSGKFWWFQIFFVPLPAETGDLMGFLGPHSPGDFQQILPEKSLKTSQTK
jgi:hypothetical protein